MAPDIPASAFESIKERQTKLVSHDTRNMLQRPPIANSTQRRVSNGSHDEWGDGGIDDNEFVHAAEQDAGFIDIDDIEGINDPIERTNQKKTFKGSESRPADQEEEPKEPTQLENGKWACGHNCKDKSSCKHLCCREGLDKKPKPKKPKHANSELKKGNAKTKPLDKTQSKLDMGQRGKGKGVTSKDGHLEHVDLSFDNPPQKVRSTPLPGMKSLSHLHQNMGNHTRIPSLHDQEPAYPHVEGSKSRLDFLHPINNDNDSFSDEGFDDSLMDNLPDPSAFSARIKENNRITFGMGILYEEEAAAESSYMDDDQEDMLDAILIGAEDSNMLKEMSDGTDKQLESHLGAESLGAIGPGRHELAPETASNMFVPQESTPTTQPPLTETNDYSPPIWLSKRKAEEEVHDTTSASTHTGFKRYRSNLNFNTYPDKPISDSYSSDMLDDGLDIDGAEPDQKGSTLTDMDELRAWVAAELGDNVELVETME